MREHFDSALKFTQSRAPGTFDMWFSQIQLEDLTDGVLTLRAKNTFAREWVTNAYLSTLTGKLRDLTGKSIQVNWVIGEVDMPLAIAPLGDEPAPTSRLTYHPSRPSAPSSRPAPPPARMAKAMPRTTHVSPATHIASAAAMLTSSVKGNASLTIPPPPPPVEICPGLNPKFTFENFIVGPSNQLAHAAALAVTGDGGKRYNPLFLCGGTGLGKSHLLHAIAHKVHADRPDRRILYVTAERFTNDYVEALQNRKMEDFRRVYRNACDVLLIDDVHSLAGRTQTQEEFFHTFNALYSLDRTIVMSSDTYPQKLDRMEERLVTRFAWGLVADIQPPDLETRVAIVRKKAVVEGVYLDDEVAVHLAQNLRSSIRELEGMVIRLAAKSSLTRQHVDMDFARAELQLVQASRPRITSMDDIQRLVCHHFSLRSSDLLSKDRSQSVTKARHIAMYLCKHNLNVSYPEIGRAFGRDHSTVMSAVKKMTDLRERDAQIRAHIEELERKSENGPPSRPS
ncbi:MAG: chromosomal replication initiator protein DnaA [Polyangiaceae bacterium]